MNDLGLISPGARYALRDRKHDGARLHYVSYGSSGTSAPPIEPWSSANGEPLFDACRHVWMCPRQLTRSISNLATGRLAREKDPTRKKVFPSISPALPRSATRRPHYDCRPHYDHGPRGRGLARRHDRRGTRGLARSRICCRPSRNSYGCDFFSARNRLLFCPTLYFTVFRF